MEVGIGLLSDTHSKALGGQTRMFGATGWTGARMRTPPRGLGFSWYRKHLSFPSQGYELGQSSHQV